MTQLEAVKAYKVLMALGNEKMSLKTAYALFKLKKALQPAFEFQVEREKEIADRYKARTDANGVYHTEKPEDMEQMRDELVALATMDSTVEVEPISISEKEDIRITPADMELLSNVVNFEG